MKKKAKLSKETIKHLFVYLKGYRVLLLFSLLFALISVLLQLYVPVLFGDAIDRLIGEGKVEFSSLTIYLVKIAVCVLTSALFVWLMNNINNRVTYSVVKDIRNDLIKHIQHLPLSYLDSHTSGDIVSRIISDTTVLSDGLLLGFTQIFSGVITIIATLYFMFSKNLWISLIVILLTPLSFVVSSFISSRSFTLFRKQSEDRGNETTLIDEIVGGLKVVKGYGYEKEAQKRFKDLNDELTSSSEKAIFYSSLANPSTRFVNNVIYAVVALIGVLFIPKGAITVGGLTVMLAYANQYMKPFNDISSVITELQNSFACASRVFELINEKEEVKEENGVLENVEGNVEIDNVAFSYDKSKSLIENLNVKAPHGTRVAIVGPTGCGKTTIINLLMRFYDPDEGTIKIDGKDILSVTRHSLRASYGMVLQETWIKSGTVRENITFGKENATEDEIMSAIKKSHCYDFISRLPNGLDTILEENSLSEGQKQLLCIARVMLVHPPMLILDEATSSIDTRTEILVQKAFDTLMEGRTSFVVAHRLSTIRNASIILVMKDGKIIEQGSHNELIEKQGFYYTLYNSQFATV